MGFEIDPDLVPLVKLGLHCAQIALSLVVWCLEIAVFTGKDAKVVGDNGWTFGVCFLSIPAWVYLIMTPRFARTRKFAEPHVMLAVDVSFTIIWLSAFATQAAYNSSGLCGKACNLSKAIVALGVFVTLLFGATSFLSAYTMTYARFHGTLPGYDNRKIRSGDDTTSIDPDKAAFSMAPNDEEAYERVHMHDQDGDHGAEAYDAPASYAHANPYSADEEVDRYGGRHTDDDRLFDHTAETEYDPRMPTPHAPPPAPSGAYGSQNVYDEPATFPAANYDRVH